MGKTTKKLPKNWLEWVIFLITVVGPAAWKVVEKLIRWLSKKDLEALLDELKKKKQAGTISEEEYVRLRERIIGTAKPEHL